MRRGGGPGSLWKGVKADLQVPRHDGHRSRTAGLTCCSCRIMMAGECVERTQAVVTVENSPLDR